MKIKVILVALLVLLVGCGKEAAEKPETTESPVIETPAPVAGENPVVTMTMENGDVIEIELYPSVAPNTVNNFISLIESGYYDGLNFHRVIPGFMVQGGDPDGNGTGGPGYGIAGEFTSNSFENDLSHTRGVISMARSQMPNSAGSQFFIMHADSVGLDGDYAAFGEVISNIEAIDTIAKVETGKADLPEVPQIIKSMSVETFGVDYPEPKTN